MSHVRVGFIKQSFVKEIRAHFFLQRVNKKDKNFDLDQCIEKSI